MPHYLQVVSKSLVYLFLLELGSRWWQSKFCNGMSTKGLDTNIRNSTRSLSFAERPLFASSEPKICRTHDDCLRISESETKSTSGKKWYCSSLLRICVECGSEENWGESNLLCSKSFFDFLAGLNYVIELIYAGIFLIIFGIVVISCFCCSCCPGYIFLKDRRERKRLQGNQNQMSAAAETPTGCSSVSGTMNMSSSASAPPFVNCNENYPGDSKCSRMVCESTNPPPYSFNLDRPICKSVNNVCKRM